MTIKRKTVTQILSCILNSHETWHGTIDEKDLLLELLEDATLMIVAASHNLMTLPPLGQPEPAPSGTLGDLGLAHDSADLLGGRRVRKF